jgi:hypothetical protein
LYFHVNPFYFSLRAFSTYDENVTLRFHVVPVAAHGI